MSSRILLLTIILTLFLAGADLSMAFNAEDSGKTQIIKAVEVTGMISQFYTGAMGIVGVLAMLMIVYGGILYTVSAGNSSKIGEARDVILNSIYGLLLLIGAYLLLNTINPTILTTTPSAEVTKAPNMEPSKGFPYTGSPVPGAVISSGYGYRDYLYADVKARNCHIHRGVDFVAAEGTPVYATGGGTVTAITDPSGCEGNRVSISNGNGYTTRYAHLQRSTVAISNEVKKGDVIGYVGNTGSCSRGAHLHYEVQLNGVPQNINNFFGSREDGCSGQYPKIAQ